MRVHSFLPIAMAISQTRQRNGILLRCAKGPHDVQNVVHATEKNVTSTILVFSS